MILAGGVLVILLAVGGVAYGLLTKGSVGREGTVVEVAAPSGAVYFEPDELKVNAGDLTVKFTNDSALPHDIVFEDPDGTEVARSSVLSGGSEDVSFRVEAGDYTFYCSVPGHREGVVFGQRYAGGMEGRLEVK